MVAPPSVLNLGGCGVLLPASAADSSASHGLLLRRGRGWGSGRVSVAPLGWGLTRRGGVFDARADGSGASGAVASGEGGPGSSGLRHIEKDLTFSPTFTDYVKIMESVKLDRSKSLQGHESDGNNSRRSFTGNDDAWVVRRGDGRSGDGRSKSFDERKGAQRNRGDANRRGMKLGNNDIQNNSTRLVEKKMLDDVAKSHRRQGKVEEYVQRRIVRGERRENEGNGDKSEHWKFTSQLKMKDTRGSLVAHQPERNKHVQWNGPNSLRGQKASERSKHVLSNGRNSLPGQKSLILSRSPPNSRIILESTKPMVVREKENISRTSRSVQENNFNYPRERKISNYDVKADGKFQRYKQTTEFSGRDLVLGKFGQGDINFNKSTVGKRYVNEWPKSGHDGHRMDGLKHVKSEAIRMQRGENAQAGKFIRRDAEATDLDDRAAFKSFEVFTDVRNRSRVLQMELEDKIQKLASRLNATDVNTPEWKFSKMIHDAKIKFSDYSILRIVQILGRYGNWKRVLQVVEWLQSRERFKSYKSRYIYTTVLDVLGKAKRPFEALNVFYTMLDQLSSYPDMAAYHCIAVTLGQAGLVKELFDVIDRMHSPPTKKFKLSPIQNWDPRLEPDLIVYNAVLNACVQQKQWEGAFWVLQQLKEKNIHPTNTTYGLVMEVMLVCGKYNLVYEFFSKVEKSSIPGALNYKVLINALWREGKVDEAVMAVKDMESRGIVGSASLYYDLARCLCSGGRCKEALLQVEKICKVANKPLVVTYTGLIQTCIDNGSMENAKYIFEEMCKYCSPNNITCNIMLKSYTKHGMFEDAKGLLENILNGRITSKVELSQKAIADKFTFNTFMEACAETKRWNDFEYAFRKMLSSGYHFDERRHLRMVLDAYRNGKEQLLEDVWNYLCHHGRVPPAPMIMERFCLKLRQGDTVAAITCINTFQESKIRNVSSMSWFKLLNRNADRLKEDNIIKLVYELNKLVASSGHSDSLYQNILSSCTEFLSGSSSVEKGSRDQQMLPCTS
ncbi:pentatricopeptide repeat-containing protein At1g30610, chloroplastic [Oryza brachyantha]|uniref:Pentacotripeptide-repeat region of PRORP domain-containing protein n=1 Tax=Oryza brachyantha TaxID=4533 RepID=J3L2T4_ORYBR|nr:pentatricopeptide repeat-containing protein At1g30610, chloroplastic [Oryza brachyantha]